MAKEFTPKRSKHCREGHELSMDPRFWKRLQTVADRLYGGVKSRAVESHLVLDWIVELSKRKTGIKHDHWLTTPLVRNEGEMEPLLERLEAGDADYVGSYLEHRVDEQATKILEEIITQIDASPTNPVIVQIREAIEARSRRPD